MNITVQKREEIKKNIEKIVAVKEADLAKYKNQLNVAIAAAEAANKKSTEYYAANDIRGYHKFQDECRLNNDAADMFRKKIAELEETPYITESEFQDAANTIYAELNDEVEAAGAEIAELVKKIILIGRKTTDSVNQWEKYVLDMQKNVRKDDCKLVLANGKVTNVINHSKLKTFEHDGLSSYMNTIRDHYYINKYLGERKEEVVTWGNV
jgi:hypothetical protein